MSYAEHPKQKVHISVTAPLVSSCEDSQDACRNTSLVRVRLYSTIGVTLVFIARMTGCTAFGQRRQAVQHLCRDDRLYRHCQ